MDSVQPAAGSVQRRARLLRLLTEYEPTEPDEQTYRRRMLDLAVVAHDPFDRAEYQPGHFTASAFVLHPAGTQLLLIHHARLDMWIQPGGHVDPSDPDPAAAAIREVGEEAGLDEVRLITDGILDIDIHPYPAGADLPEHLHFDIRFGLVSESAALDANHEVHDARWVAPEALQDLGVDRSILRPAAKLFGDERRP